MFSRSTLCRVSEESQNEIFLSVRRGKTRWFSLLRTRAPCCSCVVCPLHVARSSKDTGGAHRDLACPESSAAAAGQQPILLRLGAVQESATLTRRCPRARRECWSSVVLPMASRGWFTGTCGSDITDRERFKSVMILQSARASRSGGRLRLVRMGESVAQVLAPRRALLRTSWPLRILIPHWYASVSPLPHDVADQIYCSCCLSNCKGALHVYVLKRPARS